MLTRGMLGLLHFVRDISTYHFLLSLAGVIKIFPEHLPEPMDLAVGDVRFDFGYFWGVISEATLGLGLNDTIEFHFSR